MNRILVFHHHESAGNAIRMAPSAYFMDSEYEKVAVRIYAERAPDRDAKFDILADGVSIFNNRANKAIHPTSGVDITGDAATEAILTAGQNSEELAGDFNASTIEKGSWVSCNLVDAGGGSNFTVQLELQHLSEEEESLD